jgi:hypothetical protein
MTFQVFPACSVFRFSLLGSGYQQWGFSLLLLCSIAPVLDSWQLTSDDTHVIWYGKLLLVSLSWFSHSRETEKYRHWFCEAQNQERLCWQSPAAIYPTDWATNGKIFTEVGQSNRQEILHRINLTIITGHFYCKISPCIIMIKHNVGWDAYHWDQNVHCKLKRMWSPKSITYKKHAQTQTTFKIGKNRKWSHRFTEHKNHMTKDPQHGILPEEESVIIHSSFNKGIWC